MAVDIKKLVFENRETEKPNGRIIELDSGETLRGEVIRDEGLILNEGTPLNAKTFNDLQDNMADAIRQVESSIPTSLPPSAHAPTHAASGSDPITPASIGALPVSGGTLTGQLTAVANAAVGTPQVRNIHAGTTDLTAGSSTLATGTLYAVYET